MKDITETPFFAGIRAQVEKISLDECERRGQMTIGELFLRLQGLKPSCEIRVRTFGMPEDVQCFYKNNDWDYTGLAVSGMSSYRGYYDHLAIVPREQEKGMTVQWMLDSLQHLLKSGETLTGYKGGEYQMRKYTPVWIAAYGHATGYALMRIKLRGDTVYLEADYEE